MATAWPHREFAEYLRTLMDAKGIKDWAELSRLTGVSQNQFSTWRYGKNQPSQANLKRIAPTLGVAPIQLYLAAGINNADEMDLSQQPDMTVLPTEFRDLLELYEHLSDEQRSYVRRTLGVLVAGLRADTHIPRVRPSGRRRAG